MTARYRLVPAAYLLLRRGDQVLLQRRQHTGFMDGHWAAGAAGHVEAGESVHGAAVREAREELGIVVQPADLEPLTAMHRSQGTGLSIDERVDFFFAVRRWAGEPRAMEAKAGALRWVRLDQLDQLDGPVVPHERVVLDGLRTGTLASITAVGLPAPSDT